MKKAGIVLALRTMCILLLVLFASDGFSQGLEQQTTFGSDMEIEQPIKVPLYVIESLPVEDRKRLEECQSNRDFPNLVKSSLAEHFVGSDFVSRTHAFLIVRSNSSCFDGAHNSRFWLFAKPVKSSERSYKRIFATQADGFFLSFDAKETYPTIKVLSHTAIELFISVFKYSQGRYFEESCYAEPMGEDPPTRRIKCKDYNWEFRDQ